MENTKGTGLIQSALTLLAGILVGLSVCMAFVSWSETRYLRADVEEIDEREILPGAKQGIEDLRKEMEGLRKEIEEFRKLREEKEGDDQ